MLAASFLLVVAQDEGGGLRRRQLGALAPPIIMAPSTSSTPTSSKSPSASPTVSVSPSLTPSQFPSSDPTLSLSPSVTPTLSNAPSTSITPTASPGPSWAPSISFEPTPTIIYEGPSFLAPGYKQIIDWEDSRVVVNSAPTVSALPSEVPSLSPSDYVLGDIVAHFEDWVLTDGGGAPPKSDVTKFPSSSPSSAAPAAPVSGIQWS